MSPSEFATYVRFRTKTNTSTFTNAQILTLMKIHMRNLTQRIINVDEDYFGMPYTTDLRATETGLDVNGVSTREYPFPADMAGKLKRVEANFDGTRWTKLGEFDLNQYTRTTDEEAILAKFYNDEDHAFYDIFRESLWIYSGEIVNLIEDGLKLIAYSLPAEVTDLASTTDMSEYPDNISHGYPLELHDILADYIVIDFKTSGDKPIPLDEREQLIDKRVNEAIGGMINKNKDRIYKATTPNYSNHGYDL